jgi:hypothetical protein
MIHIDISQVKVSNTWKKKSKDKLKQLESSADRSDFLKRNPIWNELKDEFKKLSKDNCWYCETNILRHPGDMDHFRPKNEVYECTSHEGYWWLAYDYKNYRLSCGFCNSPNKKFGKRSRFPIENEHERATQKSRRKVRLEKPLLLDPIKKEDVALIGYDDAAKAICLSIDNFDQKRVDKTIEIFGINEEPGLTQARERLLDMLKEYNKGYIQACIECNEMLKKFIINITLKYIANHTEYINLQRCYINNSMNGELRDAILSAIKETSIN